MKKIILLQLIILSLFFTACKSTPTDNIVINKGDNSLMEIINKPPVDKLNGKYSAPETWKETLSGLSDDLTVNIDANIEIPNVDEYPVAEIQPDEITQEDADKILDVLIGDEQLVMQTVDDHATPTTKKAIEKEILRLKGSINDPNSNLNYFYEKGTEEYNQKLAEIQSSIKSLEEKLPNAPEVIPLKKISRKFVKKDDYGVNVIEGYTTNKEYINICKIAEKPIYLQMIKYVTSQNFSAFSSKTVDLKGITISRKDAEKKANDFLRNLGINDMKISLICSAYQTRFYDRDTMDNIYDSPQCYVFYFTKNIEGVPITYQETRLDIEALSKQFAPIYKQEYVRIIVDDTGVLEFWWEPPSKVTNIINSNVELLPFEEIQKIFKEYIPLKCDYVNDYEDDVIIHRTMNINRIVLGLTQVVKKDSPGEYMLIPTWNFFGNEVNEYPGQQPGGYILDENNEYTEEAVGRSFLTINAIDGSIIDPTVGY